MREVLGSIPRTALMQETCRGNGVCGLAVLSVDLFRALEQLCCTEKISDTVDLSWALRSFVAAGIASPKPDLASASHRLFGLVA